MHLPDHIKAICCLLLILSVCLFSCDKPKQGKVIVSEYDFYIERVTKSGFELCAKGKVKNVGEVDVKNIAVTGNCLSCTDIYTYDGSWVNPPHMEKTAEQQPGTKFIPDMEKTTERQPVINYIPIGKEEEFIIKNIAYAPVKLNQSPKKIPEKLEVVVVSFETVSEQDFFKLCINVINLS